ncbi:hypothetical protein JXA88_06110 [Candidatus Fermentibacteria bacterium]|nr:hypothetical protein [Candidatus Fermentibacteria bacterium]
MRRAVVMLVAEPADKFANAKASLDAADVGSRRGMSGSFELWIGGYDNVRTRHHPWDKSEFRGAYTTCHVFKQPGWRIYGFKCHPAWAVRFELCVLVHSASKHEHETDEKILRKVTAFSSRVDVIEAVQALEESSI